MEQRVGEGTGKRAQVGQRIRGTRSGTLIMLHYILIF